MPAKKLTITAAACQQQKPCPHAGANAGIHRLKAITNTSEGLRLLPPLPHAASWCVVDAGADPPWHHDAALRAVMSRGETLLAQVQYQQEKKESTPPSCWRLNSKKGLLFGGLMFSSACMVGAWRAYQWRWTSAGFDSEGARPLALRHADDTPHPAAAGRPYSTHSPAAGNTRHPAARKPYSPQPSAAGETRHPAARKPYSPQPPATGDTAHPATARKPYFTHPPAAGERPYSAYAPPAAAGAYASTPIAVVDEAYRSPSRAVDDNRFSAHSSAEAAGSIALPSPLALRAMLPDTDEPQALPHAAAYVAQPPSTTTLAPIPDEVKKVKLDFSCFEQRQTLTIADIVRQIGKTLKNPVSALAEESQIIYYYQHVGRCPTAGELKVKWSGWYSIPATASTSR